jgi:hypothetical protein
MGSFLVAEFQMDAGARSEPMIWVKSFLAGMMGTFLIFALALRILLAFTRPDRVIGAFPQSKVGLPRMPPILIGDGGIWSYGIGPFPIWPVGVAALLIFGSGFYWNFRGSRRHR